MDLILFHGSEGERIYIDPDKVVAIAENPYILSDGDKYEYVIKTIIMMSGGRNSIDVRERIDDVRSKLETRRKI